MKTPALVIVFAALAPLAGLSAACRNGSYSHTSVSMPEGDPAATVNLATGGWITLAEGAAVEAQISFVADDGDSLPGEVVSEAPSILTVLSVMDGGAYVFAGASVGTTEVLVIVDGRTVQTVPATVTTLPASSVPAPIDAGVAMADAHTDA